MREQLPEKSTESLVHRSLGVILVCGLYITMHEYIPERVNETLQKVHAIGFRAYSGVMSNFSAEKELICTCTALLFG